MLVSYGNKNLVNKAWKKKIVMPNAHIQTELRSLVCYKERKAVELAKMDDVEKVFINKGLSNVVPGANQIDVLILWLNG